MNIIPQKQITVHNFTVSYEKVEPVIYTEILINDPFDVTPDNQKTQIQTVAIWDTGATGSVITNKIAQKLNLTPITKCYVHGVNQTTMQNVYLVNIVLPNNVVVGPLKVTECQNLNGGFDALIGMDVISKGDFAVTNSNGKTVFSFRVPSVSRIDFTIPENNSNLDNHSNGLSHLTREERRAIDRMRLKKSRR